MRTGNRATRHEVLRAISARDRVGEEDLLRERRREPVREAEVRVRLGQRCRNPAQPGGEHHRSGYVTTRAQHDVGAAAGEDAAASEWGTHGLRNGADEVETDPAREPRDLERVELEARLRNQTRLDASARPGERHRHPARAQGFGDRERGPDVPGCSARRDQARELGRPFHSPRC